MHETSLFLANYPILDDPIYFVNVNDQRNAPKRFTFQNSLLRGT